MGSRILPGLWNLHPEQSSDLGTAQAVVGREAERECGELRGRRGSTMAARATILSLAAGVVLQAHLSACFSTVALPSAARARSHAAASTAAAAAAPASASPASQPVGAHTRWTSRAAHCSHGVAPMASATRSSTASLLQLQAVEDPTAAEREPDAIDLDIETQASGHMRHEA